MRTIDQERAMREAAEAGDWERVIVLSEELLSLRRNRGNLPFHTLRARALFELGRRWEAWVHSALTRALADRAGPLGEAARREDDEIRRELPEGPLPEAILDSFVHVLAPRAAARAVASTLIAAERGLEGELRMLRCVSTELGESPDSDDVDFLVRENPSSLFALRHRLERASTAEEQLALVEAILAADEERLAPIDRLQLRFPTAVSPALFANRRIELLVELGRTEEAAAHRKAMRLEMVRSEIESGRERLYDPPDDVEAVLGAALELARRDASLEDFARLVDHVVASHANAAFQRDQAEVLHSVITVASGEHGAAAWPLHDRLAAGLGIT